MSLYCAPVKVSRICTSSHCMFSRDMLLQKPTIQCSSQLLIFVVHFRPTVHTTISYLQPKLQHEKHLNNFAARVIDISASLEFVSNLWPKL